MLVSSINTYTSYSQPSVYNGRAVQPGNSQSAEYLPEVEPVAPVGAPNSEYNDINDINYERVNDFLARNMENSNSAGQPNPVEQPTETSEETASNENAEQPESTTANAPNADKTATNSATNPEDTKANGEALSEEEQAMVNELKTVDADVRQHEQAHLAVAGGIASGGASYSYQPGPDGKQYAVGGEVNIDTSAEDTPEATINKMNRVIAAAMAPAEPSSQDFAVASAARRTIAEMSKVQTQQNQASTQSTTSETSPTELAAEETSNVNSNSNNNTPQAQNVTISAQPVANAPADSNEPVAQQTPIIEEPISTLSARNNTASRQVELYRRSDLNSNNNLSNSSINIVA